WSGKMELCPGSDTIYQPWPVYPRLWEYIDTDLKYVGYDKTIKAAVKTYAKLTEEEFSFALDTSQPPWLCVDDEIAFSLNVDEWGAIGNDIYLGELFVQELEAGHEITTFTKAGKEVQYIGVLLLAALVEWGNKRNGILKPTYPDELDGLLT